MLEGLQVTLFLIEYYWSHFLLFDPFFSVHQMDCLSHTCLVRYYVPNVLIIFTEINTKSNNILNEFISSYTELGRIYNKGVRDLSVAQWCHVIQFDNISKLNCGIFYISSFSVCEIRIRHCMICQQHTGQACFHM